MAAWFRAIVIQLSWEQCFITYIICFMTLKTTELKPLRPDSRANFIALLLLHLRDEILLPLQTYVFPDAQSHCIVCQYQAASCVLPEFPRWNSSIIILLVWTLGQITNLMMKTESVSGASVDFKKWGSSSCGILFVEASLMLKAGKLQEYELTRHSLIGMRLLILFFLVIYLLHSVMALSRGICAWQMCLFWHLPSWIFEYTFF